MSEIEKAKATCARLKGHFTKAKNSLATQLEARKAPHIIEKGYEEANAKLKKVESHLEDMEDLDGVDDEWLSGEFQGIEDCENTLIEMIRQGEELVGDVLQEDAGNLLTTGGAR